jgi:SAM-dependent methyltransferase
MGTATTVPVRLHLGCGEVRYDGYVGVDIREDVHPDVVADLRTIWPWPDSSVDEVVAEDVFEHLPDKLHSLRELYRVLRPNGRALIQVPDATTGAAFGDPTHVSFWTLESFAEIYMRPGPFHPGGYHFEVVAYPSGEGTVIRINEHHRPRLWVRAELRAVKES